MTIDKQIYKLISFCIAQKQLIFLEEDKNTRQIKMHAWDNTEELCNKPESYLGFIFIDSEAPEQFIFALTALSEKAKPWYK